VGIVSLDPVGDGVDLYMRGALAHEARGQIDLSLAKLVALVERLALKVGQFDPVIVDDGQMTDAGSAQSGQHTAGDPAGANDYDPGFFQALLARAADLGKNDMPRVAV
jgi:hypothetical protein